MKRLLTLALLCFCPALCFAQDEINETFKDALKYLIQTQTDSTISGEQYTGEWPVYMELTEPYFFIGRRQKARDSNCFTVSAIHNALADIYLRDTSLAELQPVLARAFSEVQSYQQGQEFNFWKLLPPPKNHKFWFKKENLPLVHRPTNYAFKPRLVHKMANVANDADDTNQANLAIWYHNKVFGDTLTLLQPATFEQWTDQNRQNRNWYNYLFHTRKNSGAYLTWLAPEYRYGIWTPVHSYLSIVSIFLPTSSAYPRAYEPWIPFGANDVCPVVNANILTYLAKSGQLAAARSVEPSAQMITRMVERDMWSGAGVYYPNAYHLAYSLAKAYNSGVSELKEAAEGTANYLAETQLENGSYISKYWVNNGDTIQSTTYALHAMIDLRDAGIEIKQDQISNAVSYLLSQARHDTNGTLWKGGVYFTGGTALRNILQWHSDAYTTALIAQALQRIIQKQEINSANRL